jgi:hypothetical protein
MSSIKRVAFLTTLVTTFSLFTPAFASDPLIDLGLTQDHIIDLLKVCFSKKLRCKVLSRETHGITQVITLVGEKHTQKADAYQLGENLFRHYPIVALETGTGSFLYDFIPDFIHSRFRKSDLFIPEQSHSLGTFSGFFSNGDSTKVINLESGFRSQSSSAASVKNSIISYCLLGSGTAVTLGGGLISAYMGEGNLGLTLIGPSLLASGTGMAGLAACQFVNSIKNKSQELATIIAELRPRDLNMARNLLKALESGETSRVIGAMGRNHLYGVSRALLHHGFNDLSPQLLEQYESYLNQDHLSEQLSETKIKYFFRSFSDFLVHEIYPEVF